jgi:hypothetical protein
MKYNGRDPAEAYFYSFILGVNYRKQSQGK